jgi:hypothetical protein
MPSVFAVLWANLQMPIVNLLYYVYVYRYFTVELVISTKVPPLSVNLKVFEGFLNQGNFYCKNSSCTHILRNVI